MGLLEPLVLPKRSQMERLRSIEQYLAGRDKNARNGIPSVFSFSDSHRCFPFRYFNTDRDLQIFREKIRDQAEVDKAGKRLQRERLASEYKRLLGEADQLTCQFRQVVSRYGTVRLEHRTDCQKCSLRAKANSLFISVFEEPLPKDDIPSAIIVFELNIPLLFSVWRDTTYSLARSRTHPSSNWGVKHTLQTYQGLSRYYRPGYALQQIKLASDSKARYGIPVRFPCEDVDIIQAHPLTYFLWDSVSGYRVSDLPAIDIRPFCTPFRPSSPYASLSWAVSGTSHTPNSVIAKQSECPIQLPYHEWETFGLLRSGCRLQWRNIMQALVTGNMNLADPAVHLLVRQAAWQAETAADAGFNDVHRDAHHDLGQTSFGLSVLSVLRIRLDAVRSNWQEGWTATTLSIVASRLISLTDCAGVKAKALIFLEDLRTVTVGWMRNVLHLLNSANNSDTVLKNRLLQLAISCRLTFSFEPDVLRSIFRSPINVSHFIECAIVLENHLPGDCSCLPLPLRYFVQQDSVFVLDVLNVWDEPEILCGGGLDNGIRCVWEGFTRDQSKPWTKLDDHWVTCRTAFTADSQSLTVHLNLLQGTLRVNGKALGYLPMEIKQHGLFKSIFPDTVSGAFHRL